MIIRAGSRTVFRRSLLHALAFSPFPCRNASQGSGTSAAAAPCLFFLSGTPETGRSPPFQPHGFPPLADQLHIFPFPEQYPAPGRTHSQNANPLKKEKASGKNLAKNRVLSGHQRNLTGI